MNVLVGAWSIQDQKQRLTLSSGGGLQRIHKALTLQSMFVFVFNVSCFLLECIFYLCLVGWTSCVFTPSACPIQMCLVFVISLMCIGLSPLVFFWVLRLCSCSSSPPVCTRSVFLYLCWFVLLYFVWSLFWYQLYFIISSLFVYTLHSSSRAFGSWFSYPGTRRG